MPIIHLLPPHHANFGKRITKQSKLYFLDTSLACRLLGIDDDAALRRHPSWGPLVENWFIAEAIKQTRHTGGNAQEQRRFAEIAGDRWAGGQCRSVIARGPNWAAACEKSGFSRRRQGTED